MKIKAISIKNPWAGLIIARIKGVENRSWVRSPQGLLAICASAKPEPKYVFDMVKDKLEKLGIPYPTELCETNGVCLGTAEHVATVWMRDGKPWTDQPSRVRNVTPDELRTWWIDDQFGWILNNQREIDPVPVKGQLLIYEIDIPINYKEER